MKTAIIDVKSYDYYDKETVTIKHEVSLDVKDIERLTYFTPENLVSYLRENCVGKNTTIPGSASYFIPRIEISTLEFSVQNNYPIWSLREDLRKSHNGLITEEEFEDTIDGFLDVLIENDGKRLFLGQMRVIDISCFMNGLATNLYGELMD